MKKEHLLIHLIEHCGCHIVRVDSKGYHILRNPENKAMSGVPADDDIQEFLACRICTTLGVVTPDAVIHMQPVVNKIEQDFNNRKKGKK